MQKSCSTSPNLLLFASFVVFAQTIEVCFQSPFIEHLAPGEKEDNRCSAIPFCPILSSGRKNSIQLTTSTPAR